MRKTAWVLGLLCGLASVPAEAHLRDFLDTYSAETLEKGRSEMEIYTDLRNPDEGDMYWHNQTEFEYGVTSRYTAGLYGVFIDGQGFSAVKLENRYRMTSHGEWFFDTTAYLEFQKANGDKEQDEIEGKILLSKNWGEWAFSANPILELEQERKINGEKEWEMEAGLAAGAAYRGWKTNVTPGLEIFAKENETRITPGVYVDLMPNVRLNLGVGIGLEKKADDYQIKSILEVEF